MRKGHVPANADPIELTIDLVGGRGDGVGHAEVKLGCESRQRSVFVPYTASGSWPAPRSIAAKACSPFLSNWSRPRPTGSSRPARIS